MALSRSRQRVLCKENFQTGRSSYGRLQADSTLSLQVCHLSYPDYPLHTCFPKSLPLLIKLIYNRWIIYIWRHHPRRLGTQAQDFAAAEMARPSIPLPSHRLSQSVQNRSAPWVAFQRKLPLNLSYSFSESSFIISIDNPCRLSVQRQSRWHPFNQRQSGKGTRLRSCFTDRSIDLC